MSLNKDILRLAIPAIFTNITVPLLGLVDFSIAGHLNDSKFIGAMAIGTMMFNLIYWNFSFLRMGTTGMTAQAYGKNSKEALSLILYRGLFLSVLIGIIIWILQVAISKFSFFLLDPSINVRSSALEYFSICVWAAPFFLSTMVIKGWLLGMQNASYPMIIAIFINVINIVLSLFAVFSLNLGFKGIAIGTLSAEILGFILASILLISRYRNQLDKFRLKGIFRGKGLNNFFKVNGDIFFRSLFLLSVSLTFTSIGARAGDNILAVNALIMQLFFFYSYFMDGFAFSGEAIIGKYKGAENISLLNKSIKYLFFWGTGVAIIFSILYGGFLKSIAEIFTSEEFIINGILSNRIWCALIPIVGVGAFIWDGIFIGLTATRSMLICTLIASSAFFLIYFLPQLPYSDFRLWIAFLSFLAIRGLVLWILYMKNKKDIIRA